MFFFFLFLTEMDHDMEPVAPPGAPPSSKERIDTDDMADSIVSMMGGLSLGDCESKYRALVSGWVASAERVHRARADFSDNVGDLVLGKKPVTEEDWASMLEKIYGPALGYLLIDGRSVAAGMSGCPEETRASPRSAQIFDWLQRSEVGFLDYAPLFDWVEVCYDHYLQERILSEHIALGVGTRFAAMIAKKPKEKLYSVYWCDVTDTARPVCANNTEVDKFAEVVKQVGLEKAVKDGMQGSVYAYRPAHVSFKDMPDVGFVSGDHLVLCWPNQRTAEGTQDRVGIYLLPECYPTNGQNRDGTEKILHHQITCPPMSISKVNLLYPWFLFVTTTNWFGRLDLLKKATNFASISATLDSMRETELGADRHCDVIVALDLELNLIYRVIPIKEGTVSYLGTSPRMTCPSDLLIDKRDYRIVWNTTNVSKPAVHGFTEHEPLIQVEGAAAAGARGFYWSDPSKELDLTEQYTKKRGSAPVETPRGIYIHAGGHIVQISENNLSTFVTRHGKLFPSDNLYHARDTRVSDCVVYGNLHVTITCSGEIQFASLRAVRGDLIPRYTFTEDKLTKAGRKVPKAAASLTTNWRSNTPDPGHYKAIWISPSYRVVIQLHNGTLVFFRPRTLDELKTYLEAVAKARAEEEIRRRSKSLAEKQLAEAAAYGREPQHIHEGRKGADEQMKDGQ